MDPLSITIGCVSLATSISKTLSSISGFIRDFRDARNDLDGVSGELISLDIIVKLLKDDCNSQGDDDGGIPDTLQIQVSNILGNCTLVVTDLQELLKKHNFARLGKSAMWATSGKRDVEKLKSTLEAHKDALDLALKLVAL